ncbi:hypothetical protein TRFO_20239 [Tritrichomonas foetus]|uniref:Right handed beta helix domain-containing protein n=1 Tax=Tritrichomonas foetus TaxID=1144522 RepID=A0A1J4KGB3_9EUKA|nr:hypothetical protein TRFO_20239 [Tritrichomonas foetus]|eukprot:OHT10439.1 hypothetical protein TRFO_20239 [Tritrichomonas foetus]
MTAVTITIISANFDTFISNTNGGAVYLIECGLFCSSTSFTKCKALVGGACFLSLGETQEENINILFTSTNFTNCQSKYAGAVYLYSHTQQHSIEIINCRFNINKAIVSEVLEESDDLLLHGTGGGALVLNIMNGSLENCQFSQNSGEGQIKIVNNAAWN